MPETTLDTPDLPLADYRLLREGKTLPAKPSEAPPFETTTEAAVTASEPETDETTEEQPKPETDKPKPKRGLVDEVVKLRQAKRELEARLAAAVVQPKPEQTPAEAKPAAAAAADGDKEPQAESFSDYVQWQKEYIKWTIRQDQRAAAAETAKAAEAAVQRARAQTWQERVTSAQAGKPDFDAVALNKDLPVTAVMGDAITDSEIGADILYHLGKNPAEAARIAKLSPVAQIREIGKLEFQLAQAEAEGEDVPSPVTPAVSKAPAPIARPSGGTPRPNPVKNIEGMTQAEYRAYRESGKIR